MSKVNSSLQKLVFVLVMVVIKLTGQLLMEKSQLLMKKLQHLKKQIQIHSMDMQNNLKVNGIVLEMSINH